MKQLLKKAGFAAEQVVGFVGFIAILIITANVVCRFILKIPMSWSDEFLRTLFVYGYFIGAALMFCDGGAMRLELFDGLMKRSNVARMVIQSLLGVVNVGFFGCMTYYLYNMIAQFIATGTTTSTSSTPAWVMPLGFILGTLLITLCALYNLVKLYVRKQTPNE